jgi:hypothetical protein
VSAVAFDTLKFAQNLRDKANFSPSQAEGISQAFSEAIAGQLATRDDLINLATKDDVSAVKRRIEAPRKQNRGLEIRNAQMDRRRDRLPDDRDDGYGFRACPLFRPLRNQRRHSEG